MPFAMFNTDASYTGFHGVSLALLVLAIILVVVWLLVFAQRYFATFPKLPPADPATNDLRDEPPAVVNLLANRWKPTRIAMAATLLDLAARKILDIQQLDRDHFVVHIERVPADESTLAPYERQMLDFIRARATGGSAPVEALTLGDEGDAEAWWKRFAGSISNDAKRRGLARNRWSPSDWAGLGGLLAVTLGALGLALAAAHVGGGKSASNSSDDWNPLNWLLVAFVGWGAVMAWLRSLRALRDTPAGQKACAHWLGVREYLRNTHAFDELPPAAVIIWERYLSYGAALGAAHDAVQALPFAVEEPGTAWSRATGTWRQIRIEYPARFGYGESPGSVFFGGLVRAVFWGALCFVALPVVTDIAYSIIKDVLTTEQRTSNQLYIVLGLGAFVIIVGAYLFIRFLAGVIRLVRGFRDFGSHVTVEGPIVKAYQGRFAVDDGKADEVDAWSPPATGPHLARGMKVRVTMTPHLHHVTEVAVLSSDGIHPELDASAAASAGQGAGVPPLTVDAAAVNAITGLHLQPVDAKDAGRSADGFLTNGAASAAFSDGTNHVVLARAPAAGPALAMFGAVSRIPGLHAAKVDGLGGDAFWLGARTLVVHEPAGFTLVAMDTPGIDTDRRLAMARELATRLGEATPA